MYALVDPNNNIVREESIIDITVATRQGWRWLPVENNGVPGYDTHNQKPEGPFISVHEDRVVKYWTIRDKTPEEHDYDKCCKVDALTPYLIRILLDYENRIRAASNPVLESLTEEQYKEKLKDFI